MSCKEIVHKEQERRKEEINTLLDNIPVITQEEIDTQPELKDSIETASRIEYWNYRVMRHYSTFEGTYYDKIHEVHYDEDGNVITWTEDGVDAFGEVDEEGKSEIYSVMQDMFIAITKPILEYGTGKEINKYDPKYSVSIDEKDLKMKEYIDLIRKRKGSGEHGDIPIFIQAAKEKR